MKKITFSLLAFAASVMIATAQAPAKFNYQGIARSAGGAPLASKPLGMRISIHDLSPTGTVVYSETQTTSTNPYGLYNVIIGGGTPVSGTLSGVAWGTGDKYIQIEVDPAGGTSYTDLGASQLLSVPYALNAANAGSGISGTVNTIPKFVTATTLGNSTISETAAGRVGINNTNPGARMQINNSVDSIALYVNSAYTGSAANNIAVLGENNSTSTTNPPIGVYGYGVPSLTSTSGLGIYGIGGNVGVRGNGYSSTTSTTAAVFGVYGISYTNGNAYGTYGAATAYSAVGGTKYGIYGTAANGTTNIAGYFGGNVAITGSISKGSGTFKIDHPLDPDNKYLYHSFVESPDMMNIYNGNITTDANGYATVTMPSYFNSLNKDFRYQLTVIGTFAQAIVKSEMNGNSFVIQTNQPNVKVSWQVTGVRQDAYANAHRVQPEVQKETENKGKYLHPVELGKPATSEINYELNHPKMGIEESQMIKTKAH